MKNIMRRSLTVLAAWVAGITLLSAQCKEGLENHPERARAEEKVAIYTDAVAQKNYPAAVAAHQWLLKNAPKWNTRLYIDGVTIYDALASAEKDPKRKAVLIDSVEVLHDLRIQNCGDELNVLNRKAIYSAKFNAQNKDKVGSVLKLFDRVFELSGNKVLEQNLVVYMQVIQLNQAYNNNLTQDEILERYDRIVAICDDKIRLAGSQNKTDEVERLRKIKIQVDELLLKIKGMEFNCAFVKDKLEPKFNANPNDEALAKRIFVFMTNDGCFDDPLWLKAAEKVYQTNKEFGLAINLARIYAKNGNLEKAGTLLDEAIKLATSQEDKIRALITQGDLLSQQGNKTAAREAYRKVLQVDGNNKDAYEKIGDLYINSFKDCAKTVSKAEDRLIYIAAYEMYQRAGNAQKLAAAKSNFPSKEEIFELDWKVGDNKPIGCWIGEVVSIRTRD